MDSWISFVLSLMTATFWVMITIPHGLYLEQFKSSKLNAKQSNVSCDPRPAHPASDGSVRLADSDHGTRGRLAAIDHIR